MFPDNTHFSRWSLRRLRLLLLAALLAGGGGLALWWTGARGTGAEGQFEYLHATLSPPPTGQDQTVFEVTGPNGKQGYTLAQLAALPAVKYTAYQPQLKQTFVYTGVPLRDLARLSGLGGSALRVLADNQFGATIEVSDYTRFPVLLAYQEDGHPISVAHKGPLMVVLPNLQTRIFDGSGALWVWYVVSIAAAPP